MKQSLHLLVNCSNPLSELLSIAVSAISSWNKTQTAFSDVTLKNLTPNKVKVLQTK